MVERFSPEEHARRLWRGNLWLRDILTRIAQDLERLANQPERDAAQREQLSIATRGRPKTPLTVSPPERRRLEGWVHRPKTAQVLALRARIVLSCAQGLKTKR